MPPEQPQEQDIPMTEQVAGAMIADIDSIISALKSFNAKWEKQIEDAWDGWADEPSSVQQKLIELDDVYNDSV